MKKLIYLAVSAMAIGATWIFIQSPHRDAEAINTVEVSKSDVMTQSKPVLDDITGRIRLSGTVWQGSMNNISIALISIDSDPSRQYRVGDRILNGWAIKAVNQNSIDIEKNNLTQRILITENIPATTQVAPSDTNTMASEELQRKLNFSSSVRPNLNKPDNVDQATWDDMKSKYGL